MINSYGLWLHLEGTLVAHFERSWLGGRQWSLARKCYGGSWHPLKSNHSCGFSLDLIFL